MATNTEKAEFCARFKVRMMTHASVYDGTSEELSEYADQVAPTYWEEPDQRVYGPEECADTDASYWEES